MKYHHNNPANAVEIFTDINSEYAFGIHWNTFVLTAEPINEPPKALSATMKANLLDEDRFQAIAIGAT